VFLYSHMYVLWFIFILCMYYCFIHCYYSAACTFDVWCVLFIKYSILNNHYGWYHLSQISIFDGDAGCRYITAAACYYHTGWAKNELFLRIDNFATFKGRNYREYLIENIVIFLDKILTLLASITTAKLSTLINSPFLAHPVYHRHCRRRLDFIPVNYSLLSVKS